MENQLINFALAKTLYNKQLNFLDTFGLFVLKFLKSSSKPLDTLEISHQLKNKSNLDIPIHTLRHILKSFHKEKLVTEISIDGVTSSYSLTDKGLKFSDDNFEVENDIQRRINKLVSEFNNYSEIHFKHKYTNVEELRNQLLKFISSSIPKLITFSFDISFDGANGNGSTFGDSFICFIGAIEKNEPELFTIFSEILRGAIIWNESSKLQTNTKPINISSLVVYLDTNFILGLLGLIHPTLNKAANQLFEILQRDYKINIRIFDKTIDELIRLLRSYKSFKDLYNPDVPVNHIFYYLRQANYDDADIDLLCSKLTSLIEEKNISIDPLQLVKLEDEIYKDLYQINFDLEKHRIEKGEKTEETIHKSTLHDASVMRKIYQKRGRYVYDLESCKYIFLTSSKRLFHFSEKYSKEHNNGFSTTILDHVLTNIVWLKNPKGDINFSLFDILTVHSKQFIVDNSIWLKFINVLKDLKKQKSIDQDEYAKLISFNQITRRYLTNTKEENINEASILKLSREYKNAFVKKDNAIKKKDEHISNLTSAHELATQEAAKERTKRLEAEKINSDLQSSVANLTERLQKIEYENDLETFKKNQNKKVFRGIIKLIVALVICFGLYIGLEFINTTEFQTKHSITTFWCSIIKGSIAAILFILALVFGNLFKKEYYYYVFNREKFNHFINSEFLKSKETGI